MLQGLKDHTENSVQWARAMSIALQGRSFSDLAREITLARRQAALRGEGLDVHLAATLKTEGLSKQGRIDLAVALVDQGMLSARKAQELTGVARDTIRTRKRAGQTDSAAEEMVDR